MHRGLNVWIGSGNIASDLSYGKTHGGDDACNFRLAVEQAYKQVLYVRVNIYGRNVFACERNKLMKGDYVSIEGELMNRKGQEDTLTEVRCKDIVFHSRNRRESYGNR